MASTDSAEHRVSAPRDRRWAVLTLIGLAVLSVSCLQEIGTEHLASRVGRTASRSGQVLYAKTTANIRKGPGLSHGVRGRATAGEKLYYVQRVGDWYQLESPGAIPIRWIHTSVVSEKAFEHISAKDLIERVKNDEEFEGRTIILTGEVLLDAERYPARHNPGSGKLTRRAGYSVAVGSSGRNLRSGVLDLSSNFIDVWEVPRSARRGQIIRWIVYIEDATYATFGRTKVVVVNAWVK